MAALVWTYLLATALTGAENFVVNPGFEQMEGASPAKWGLYVAPMPGAEGRVDGEDPYDGTACIQLHNPEIYEREPANNWSQNIIAELGEKRLRLAGAIRTRDATEAALWVQCCTRQPWRVLSFVSTSDTHPRYGSSGWEEVSVEFDVPEATDFIAVRCVLKGRGTAWFDNLVLSEVSPAPSPEPGSSETAPAEAATVPETDPVDVPEDIEKLRGLMEELRTELDEAAEVSEIPGAVPAEEAGLHTLLLDTRDTMDAVTWDLMQSNLQMKQRLDSLIQQIDVLQRQLEATSDPVPDPLPELLPDRLPEEERPAVAPYVFPFEEKLR